MSGVYWGALMNAPNPGQAFAESFGAGMQQAQEQRRLQAEKQEQLSREQQEEWKKYAGNLAAWADTPEKWDQAVDYLAQSGYPAASQLKGKFSPGLRAHFMAQAGIAPPQPKEDPGLIREFEVAKQRGLIPQNMDFTGYVALKNPGMQTPIIRPHNVVPVTEGGAPPVRVNSPQEVEALPPGSRFIAPDGSVRVKPGGTGSNAGGGFPR